MESNDEVNEVVQDLSFDELTDAVERANRVVKLIDAAYKTPTGHIVAQAIDFQQSGKWVLKDGFTRAINDDFLYESCEEALEVAREMIDASPEYDLVD